MFFNSVNVFKLRMLWIVIVLLLDWGGVFGSVKLNMFNISEVMLYNKNVFLSILLVIDWVEFYEKI